MSGASETFVVKMPFGYLRMTALMQGCATGNLRAVLQQLEEIAQRTARREGDGRPAVGVAVHQRVSL